MALRRGKEPGIQLPHLRAWRRKRFWAQDELAAKVGRTKGAISAVENGKPTSLVTIRRLAEAFGISPEQLINEGPDSQKLSDSASAGDTKNREE